mgnify:FL=1
MVIVGDAVLQAHAKLNLTLKILGQRPDGYHDIESVVQSIELCDRISVKTSSPVPVQRGKQEIDVKLTCNDPSIPAGRGNLAVDAAFTLAEFAGLRASVEINIEKGIPVAAGLAGGSADAAAVLVGLNDLWQLGLSKGELMTVGEKLGADIPFCVVGGTGIIRGKGERVESLPTPNDLWFVVMPLPERIGAAQAYTRFDRLTEAVGGSGATPDASDVTSRMIQAIRAGRIRGIADVLTNDLERAAVSMAPSVAGAKQALLTAGALGVGMSGSGPTVFGLADSRMKAEEIRSVLQGALVCKGVACGVTRI